MPRSGPLLLDSDCLLLFAGAGLIIELADAVEVDLAALRRLSPLPQMLRSGALARRYPVGLRQRAEAWCSRIAAVETAPGSQTLALLLGIHGIDPGEALLLAVAAETETAYVATGDKRACTALASAPPNLRAQLHNKVLCIEPALELILDKLGYPALAPALTQVREHNATLRVLLPQGEATPESTFRAGLTSYSNDVRSRLGDLLFWPHGRR